MRKTLAFIAVTMITGTLMAGGLVTNTNQSASWVRLPSRNASTEIDAVYYNPAGLLKLEDGLHISLSNQTIFQTREVKSTYQYLNSGSFKGTVTAPLFPSIYAAYKKDRLAFSFGFVPVGGGGGAEYKDGLPSFVMSPSDLVPSLQAKAGVQGYKLDVYFKGSSIFFGFQGGVSYKLSDMISFAVGLRYISAKNTYEGYLRSIQLDMGGGTWLPATTVLGNLSAQLTGITGIPATLAPLLPTAGNFTPTQLVGAGQMSAATKASLEAALAAIGVPAANIPAMTLNQISGTVTAATPALKDQIAGIDASASLVADQAADVEQTGSAITPFFNINITPVENLNIAIKYELPTTLQVTNKTAQDLKVGYYTKNGFVTSPQSQIPDLTKPITMFPDGEHTRNDMPGMISLGADYKMEKMKISLGGNYYFDKAANYGHKVDDDLKSSTPSIPISNKDIISNNGMSIQGGLEYYINDKFLVSGGYIYANKGVNSSYQSDLTYGLATHTFGIGGAYSVTEKIKINLGGSFTKYVDDSRSVTHILGTTPVYATETYSKQTMVIGVGVDMRF